MPESFVDELHITSETGYLPPWNHAHIIGIAGSSGSGKTSIASQVIKGLKVPWTILLSMDNFYKDLNDEQRALAFKEEYDLDSPDALDFDLLLQCLKNLKEGKKVEIPNYSFSQHQRIKGKTTTIHGANVIILEGIFALYDERILDLLDTKVFVDTEIDICMVRRIKRDILYRDRQARGIIKQWFKYVRPAYDNYVRPTMNSADIIVPRGLENIVATDLLIRHIQKNLQKKSEEHLKILMQLENANRNGNGKFSGNDKVTNVIDLLPGNVKLLPQTSQVGVIHTILLDANTLREDFRFYFERMASLLLYSALNELGEENLNYYTPYSVTTPLGGEYSGLGGAEYDGICAVSILQAGGCFELSLRKTIPDIRIGKVLILSSARTGEPHLHYTALPESIGTMKAVLLMDSQVVSGAAAIMAVQVLIDYGVSEERIVFVTYIAAYRGIRRLSNAFPKIRIIVGKIARILDSYGSSRFIDSKYYGA